MPVPQLFAQLKLLGNGLITVEVGGVEVIQQTPALANHHQQPATGTVVLLVTLQVLGQMIDALGKQRNLHISRAGIPFVELKIANRLRLRFHISNCGNLSRFLIVTRLYFCVGKL